ncbi:ATP-binding protein [Senegalia massiliensis]|uniref:4Fe-4S dicluster domain-containing protein n=1 Tax=Senegalia massiliensis TaxID=1720316 RepID=A0A845R0P4_9CLOT|nr:ATP-binding protein [Senegalia massiliensis]NBI08000.1 4Fe-4S dicluster domain-containing protein [Senegalia massiliensis]
MQKLLILSGKGGTGKTTIASSFVKLSEDKVFADCDVDAPNLHLVIDDLSKSITKDYYGMDKSYIHSDICISCGKCFDNCRFDAIVKKEDSYKIDTYSCEGCGVCELVCPVNAAKLQPDIAGRLDLYTEDKVFSTAELKMGSGTSGKLVTKVKERLNMPITRGKLAIIDGSPGIGCPVIASITGVDMVLVVAEPSISGITDMKRIVETSYKFGIKTAICINKYDVNIDKSQEIEYFCKNNEIPMIGKLPFDRNAIKAINIGKTIVDIDCEIGEKVKDVFNQAIKILNT